MKTFTVIKQIFLFTLISFTLYNCDSKEPKTDFALEKEQILKLHNAQRDYHFNKDSLAFANQLSGHFISVNKDKISSPKQSEIISRYNDYFSSVEFLKWDDVSKPIIKFSDDGNMAYTIVEKIVEITHKDDQENSVKGKTHFARTAIYKKYGGKWKIDCVTSTNRPIEE